MVGALFMLGTVVIEGGLVMLLMWLFTQGDRDARRGAEMKKRLTILEAEEARIRKAAGASVNGWCRGGVLHGAPSLPFGTPRVELVTV